MPVFGSEVAVLECQASIEEALADEGCPWEAQTPLEAAVQLALF